MKKKLVKLFFIYVIIFGLFIAYKSYILTYCDDVADSYAYDKFYIGKILKRGEVLSSTGKFTVYYVDFDDSKGFTSVVSIKDDNEMYYHTVGDENKFNSEKYIITDLYFFYGYIMSFDLAPYYEDFDVVDIEDSSIYDGDDLILDAQGDYDPNLVESYEWYYVKDVVKDNTYRLSNTSYFPVTDLEDGSYKISQPERFPMYFEDIKSGDVLSITVNDIEYTFIFPCDLEYTWIEFRFGKSYGWWESDYTLDVGEHPDDVYIITDISIKSTDDVLVSSDSKLIIDKDSDYYEDGSRFYCKIKTTDGYYHYTDVSTLSIMENPVVPDDDNNKDDNKDNNGILNNPDTASRLYILLLTGFLYVTGMLYTMYVNKKRSLDFTNK